MPERLGVAISTLHGSIELPWNSRDQLLHEIRHLDGADRIRAAFDAVGASHPVPLSRGDKVLLFHAINTWTESVTIEQLPEGMWKLRNALADDFHDAPDPAA